MTLFSAYKVFIIIFANLRSILKHGHDAPYASTRFSFYFTVTVPGLSLTTISVPAPKQRIGMFLIIIQLMPHPTFWAAMVEFISKTLSR